MRAKSREVDAHVLTDEDFVCVLFSQEVLQEGFVMLVHDPQLCGVAEQGSQQEGEGFVEGGGLQEGSAQPCEDGDEAGGVRQKW